jgi:hypothetical protein
VSHPQQLHLETALHPINPSSGNASWWAPYFIFTLSNTIQLYLSRGGAATERVLKHPSFAASQWLTIIISANMHPGTFHVAVCLDHAPYILILLSVHCQLILLSRCCHSDSSVTEEHGALSRGPYLKNFFGDLPPPRQKNFRSVYHFGSQNIFPLATVDVYLL